MDVKIEFVDCPFCDGKMVPLSGWIYEGRIKKAVPLAEWKCVKCGYSVSSGE